MTRHQLALLSAAALVLSAAALLVGQPGEQTVTLRRKTSQLVLRPSARYAAFRLADGISAAQLQTAVQGNVISRGLFQSPILAAKRLLLVGTTPAVQPASEQFSRLIALASPGSTRVPSYSVGNLDVIATDDVLVRFIADASEAERNRIAALVDGQFVDRPPGAAWTLRISGNRSAIDASNALNEQQAVQYAEPDFVVVIPPRPRVPAAGTPAAAAGAAPVAGVLNDPLFPRQWSLRNRGVGNKNADIRIEGAWSGVTTTRTIKVAVLDEGVDVRHPDLKDKIVDPYDAMGLLPPGKQDPNPWDAHGTAVAGIIAAGTNNQQGIAAVGYDTRLMPIRIASTDMPTNPADPNPWVTTTRIMGRGIRYAVDHGADVLNNSWNGGNDGLSEDVEDALKHAVTAGRNGAGAVVIFSAGNTGSAVVWPATLARALPIIAVAATNEWDEIKTRNSQDKENWWASSVGPEVTVAAPGVHILTTDNVGDDGFVKGDDYASAFNATSSATPHVAGVAALLLARNPRWSAQQVKDRIKSTADPLTMPDGTPATFGRLNACKAVGVTPC